ncbi:cytochrome P450 4V2-like [Dermacentor andersoni]|uniref:cytochrome P450 4V2-like n=1 Tax=Dermacentor andersoni TaxID=34620 RepID=UPI00241638C0|nr:cytochrome P450 4V2-like [Dermacentor andersoni]
MRKIRQRSLIRRATNETRRKPGQPSIQRKWLHRGIRCVARLCGVLILGIPVMPSFSGFLMTAGLFSLLVGLTYFFERERVFKTYLGFQPVVVLFKPEAVESVLNCSTNLKKPILYSLLHAWLGTGLLTSSGSKWKSRRKMLTPAFHFRILEDFLPIMNEQGEIFAQALQHQTHCVIDITKFVTACTLDIICETAMGVKVNAQTNPTSTYVSNIYRVGSNFINRAVRPWLWLDSLYRLTRNGRLYHHDISAIHTFTKKVIRERKDVKLAEKRLITDSSDELKKRPMFLDVLLDHHINENSISEEDIREEVDTFMFEGHDTTSAAISWCIYLLGHSLEAQKKVQDEMDLIFACDRDRYATVADLKEMKFLECCIKESLRLFPSVPIIGREIYKEFCINGRVVPEGSIVIIFSYMLHRDPKTFPQPEEFRPERFLPENTLGRHPFAYVPFSAGPRNCIGQRFALMEEKIVLSNLFRRFSVRSLVPRDQLKLAGELVLRNKTGIEVTLSPRQNTHAVEKHG